MPGRRSRPARAAPHKTIRRRPVSLSKVPTGRLLELYLLYYEKASGEILEPNFKTSEQIEEEQEAKRLLGNVLAIEAA